MSGRCFIPSGHFWHCGGGPHVGGLVGSMVVGFFEGAIEGFLDSVDGGLVSHNSCN